MKASHILFNIYASNAELESTLIGQSVHLLGICELTFDIGRFRVWIWCLSGFSSLGQSVPWSLNLRPSGVMDNRHRPQTRGHHSTRQRIMILDHYRFQDRDNVPSAVFFVLTQIKAPISEIIFY